MSTLTRASTNELRSVQIESLPSMWEACIAALLLSLGWGFSTAAIALTSPTVTLTSARNPTVFGGPVALTALIQGVTGNPAPTGTVTFSDSLLGGTPLCVSSVGFLGGTLARASCTLPGNAVPGEHILLAIYNGDSVYKATISNQVFQGVIPSYTVRANAGPNGQMTPVSFQQVARGENLTFLLRPDGGYHVVGVTASSGCSGVLVATGPGSSTYNYITNGIQFDCVFSAAFSNTYAVSFSAGSGGKISPTTTQNIVQGATTSVTVTPDFGFRLTNVNGCGVVFFGGTAITGPTTWTTGAINSDCTVSAFFTALPTFTVTTSAGSGGLISPTSRSVPQGATGSFTVSANLGFEIASVTGCAGSLSGSTYTTGAITAACTVFASFRIAPVNPPPITTTPMIEYLHPALDYYFISSRPADIALLDVTAPFVRTGERFSVYPSTVAGTHSITRFYFDQVATSSTSIVHGSHFYTLVDAELNALIGINPGNSTAPKLPFREGTDSFAFLPLVEGVGGSCAASLVPVLRLFRGNVRFPNNPNHRFTTSTALYNSFVALGWDGEGVKFCVPG